MIETAGEGYSSTHTAVVHLLSLVQPCGTH